MQEFWIVMYDRGVEVAAGYSWQSREQAILAADYERKDGVAWPLYLIHVRLK